MQCLVHLELLTTAVSPLQVTACLQLNGLFSPACSQKCQPGVAQPFSWPFYLSHVAGIADAHKAGIVQQLRAERLAVL